MKNKETEKEVGYTGQEKLNTAITFIVITAVVILTAVVALMAILQHDFEKAETKFFEDFTLSSPPELWERVPDLLIYPWNEYHKYSTRELSREQNEFLQGKKVAECMVDMVNYDSILIQDKESAVSLLYAESRRLLTDDDKEYYVWNQIQIEGIYLFAMVNMSGEIFSFRYVTDMEYEGMEAIQYVRESFKNTEDLYFMGHEFNEFENNRKLFIEAVNRYLTKYENMSTEIFYQNIDLKKKPTVKEENGHVVLVYISEVKTDYFIFLYLDCKTKKISAYHLMLY